MNRSISWYLFGYLFAPFNFYLILFLHSCGVDSIAPRAVVCNLYGFRVFLFLSKWGEKSEDAGGILSLLLNAEKCAVAVTS